jgi:deoxyribodipyrimidine photo-lyase
VPGLPRLGDARGVLTFVGGESAALARMQHYFVTADALREYKVTRNGLLGPNYSSKLSAWLAAGCVSPRSVAAEVRAYEARVVANDSTYWLLFELLWRDYFRLAPLGWGRSLFLLGGPRGVHDPSRLWRQDARLLGAWATGRTGYPFVDANMRELKHTGFMSNRGRQNVASYLVHNLQLDWRKGARYFEKMLVDYDVFSNWGNWAYLGGVGNDPRENRHLSDYIRAQEKLVWMYSAFLKK